MEWYNPPPQWNISGDQIHLATAPNTDFWRKKPAGPFADNGHFYFQSVTGNFAAEVKFKGDFREQYVQAGMMIRKDETTWVKCGIELFNGVQHVSAVVTKIYSDWSIQPLLPAPTEVWMRVVREGDIIEVFWSPDGQDYRLIRQAYLTESPTLDVGIMAAAPTGSGFAVTFEGLSIQPGL